MSYGVSCLTVLKDFVLESEEFLVIVGFILPSCLIRVNSKHSLSKITCYSEIIF
jgi:hypothetical protein